MYRQCRLSYRNKSELTPLLINREPMVMPRFFLHIKHGGSLIEDLEGFNLPDLDAAQVEALEGLRTILADAIIGGAEPAADLILVVDEHGRELASVALAQALPAKLRSA